MSGARWRVVLVGPALSMIVACGAADPALAPTPLPDLAKLAPSAQTQIRDAHARVTSLVAARAPAADRSAAFGELGRLLLAAQFPDAPEPCFLNAEALDGSDFRWPYFLAQVYRARGEAEQAAAAFERAAALEPDDVATQVWLGEIQLQLGRPEAAAPRFARALELQPSSLSGRFGLGRTALARQDYAGAVTHLEAVLAQDATAAAAHYPLSLAYRGLGDTARADAELARRASHEILPADPLMVELETLLESPQSYETRGIRALEAGDAAAAEAAFRQGLALAPGHAALHHRLGAALNVRGDLAGARAAYERAVQLSPDQFLAHYSLGLLDQEDRRPAAAAAHFAAALTARSSYVPARVRLASSLRRIDRAAEALAAYRRVLDDDPRHAEANVGYAMTLAQLGRYGEAREHLESAWRAAPESVVFAHGLARLLATAPDARVRDGVRARDMVESLVAKGRTLDLGETMAMTLAELGEYPRAVAVQRDLVTAATRAGLVPVVARLTANLERYERRQPCRVPWTEQEWP
jgi:protein O-GlcNAc transferase